MGDGVTHDAQVNWVIRVDKGTNGNLTTDWREDKAKGGDLHVFPYPHYSETSLTCFQVHLQWVAPSL